MQVKPTRMGLLQTKKKLKLASKGHKLLKEKRDALVMDFFDILKEIKNFRKEIADDFRDAQYSLQRAEALIGTQGIEEIASSLTGEVEFKVTEKSLMGVKIPLIEDVTVNKQWFSLLDSNLELDNAVMKYRKLFVSLMKLVEKQIALNKLAEDIKKTKRKVNSLEYIIMPRLEDTKKMITFKLEEQERENFTRLKKIKKKSG